MGPHPEENTGHQDAINQTILQIIVEYYLFITRRGNVI